MDLLRKELQVRVYVLDHLRSTRKPLRHFRLSSASVLLQEFDRDLTHPKVEFLVSGDFRKFRVFVVVFRRNGPPSPTGSRVRIPSRSELTGLPLFESMEMWSSSLSKVWSTAASRDRRPELSSRHRHQSSRSYVPGHIRDLRDRKRRSSEWSSRGHSSSYGGGYAKRERSSR